MSEYEFIDYWLNPCNFEVINDRIRNNIEKQEVQKDEELIQQGIVLLKNGKLKEALDYFTFGQYDDENKYNATFHNNNDAFFVYRIAILQNISPNDSQIDKMLQLELCHIDSEQCTLGNDAKIYYDVVKSSIKSYLNQNEVYLYPLEIIKGYRYSAYLGYERAFDELIDICNTDFLPGVDRQWAEEWEKIKKDKITASRKDIYEEVKEIIDGIQESSDNIEVKFEKVLDDQSFEDRIRFICNEFLSCHEKSKFMTASKMIKYFGVPNNEMILIAHDDTLVQNGKNGFIITEKGIYCRGMMEKDTSFTSYKNLTSDSKIYMQSNEIFADNHKLAYYCGNAKTKDELMSLFEKIVSVCDNMSDNNMSDIVLDKQVAEDKHQFVSIKKTQMFCTSCGKQIDRNIKFCNFCGAKIAYVAKEEM